MQQLQALCDRADSEGAHTGHIAARSVEARDQAKLDRVGAHHENDWYRWGRRFGGQRGRRAVGRHDHSHPMLNQVGGHDRQSIVAALRPTIFDRDVLALDVASFGQALVKSSNQLAPGVRRRGIKKSDQRNCRLLRARLHRPRHSRASEKGDELAPR